MIEVAIGTLLLTLLVMALAIGLLAARRGLIPQENMIVTVNDTMRIDAARGDTLLSALQGAGVAVPAACGGKGTCGLCRVAVTGDGAGVPVATERGILSPSERRDHVRLACQVSLRGAVDVSVAAGILEAESIACRVLSNRMLAPLIRELVLALPDGTKLDFIAGSFMQLNAPAFDLDFSSLDIPTPYEEAWRIAGWTDLSVRSDTPVTRAYSIANRPEDTEKLVFNIRLAVPPAGQEGEVPPGIVSSYLFSLENGDTVSAAGPFGDFRTQPTDKDMVLIGGGVGMAPLRAMIHEQIGQGTGRRMFYFYGARTRADLFYVDEFDTIAASHETFSWTPALSDPAPGDRWTGETGFIHEIVYRHLSTHPAPEDCEYYLCGPPVMISAVRSTLERLGVERSSIFNDDFGT
ncbi:Na+-transporting NADH:ubiquinone oxidoreductase subunit F [Jannaschia faecimaris]|uniref:Na(+)-translocating NADH-quinone reductase subunit F n=1 Tax=Jannaschia faecimaris TaxID=1244108 RepID=A0A1H3SA15_9RHOB|nr:NADH:ubiquinone reductase (Na(+)-transporting) subunit F [Jannaschia faecimaris]SDZ34764.1 Na+-transporting NADH:ubiquinone oxidoreductase subunit F [Jannaschia faecimaris]